MYLIQHWPDLKADVGSRRAESPRTSLALPPTLEGHLAARRCLEKKIDQIKGIVQRSGLERTLDRTTGPQCPSHQQIASLKA
jgi:hypothetical protein